MKIRLIKHLLKEKRLKGLKPFLPKITEVFTK